MVGGGHVMVRAGILSDGWSGMGRWTGVYGLLVSALRSLMAEREDWKEWCERIDSGERERHRENT